MLSIDSWGNWNTFFPIRIYFMKHQSLSFFSPFPPDIFTGRTIIAISFINWFFLQHRTFGRHYEAFKRTISGLALSLIFFQCSEVAIVPSNESKMYVLLIDGESDGSGQLCCGMNCLHRVYIRILPFIWFRLSGNTYFIVLYLGCCSDWLRTNWLSLY